MILQGPTESCDPPLDAPTLVAIAIVSTVLASVAHEALGHGGACLLTGGKPIALSSVHFECDTEGPLVAAAGTLLNFVVGGLAWLLLRGKARRSPQWQYFLWLTMTINLLQGAGYFLFSGVADIGDWAVIIAGRHPAWVWRGGLTLLGIGLYLFCVRLALVELRPFLGRDSRARARRLTWVAYLTGGLVSCLAGLFNPVGLVLVGISAAAASFGGTSGLAWMPEVLDRRWLPQGDVTPVLGVGRSRAWLITGGAALVLFIAVLGPGIRFQ